MASLGVARGSRGGKDGVSDGNRTHDPLNHNQVL